MYIVIAPHRYISGIIALITDNYDEAIETAISKSLWEDQIAVFKDDLFIGLYEYGKLVR